jgi:hypothetical protein
MSFAIFFFKLFSSNFVSEHGGMMEKDFTILIPKKIKL